MCDLSCYSLNEIVEELQRRGGHDVSHPDVWYGVINRQVSEYYEEIREFPRIFVVRGKLL